VVGVADEAGAMKWALGILGCLVAAGGLAWLVEKALEHLWP